MNMARYEQETIINFNEEEKTAGIYTHNKMLRQKLAALARDRPEDCRLVKASRSGRVCDFSEGRYCKGIWSDYAKNKQLFMLTRIKR